VFLSGARGCCADLLDVVGLFSGFIVGLPTNVTRGLTGAPQLPEKIQLANVGFDGPCVDLSAGGGGVGAGLCALFLLLLAGWDETGWVVGSFPVAEVWFEARDVADGLTVVTEPHVADAIRSNVYFLRGVDADLVVDTGTGVAPLRPVLAGVRGRVLAVATHAHYDHVGGMHEFAERLVHRAEAAALAGAGQFASLLGQDFPPAWRAQLEADGSVLPPVLVNAIPREGFVPSSYVLRPAAASRLLEEGDVVSLGDRELAVLHCPGHSPGSICLHDGRAGLLFSGDTVYQGRLYDRLPGSDAARYAATMIRLRSLPGVRLVCPGHGPCFDGAILAELCDAYLAARGPGTRPGSRRRQL
jgi:glyoxylase-like metal-dependent hydrolase (beta-lactamase superfamily II)